MAETPPTEPDPRVVRALHERHAAFERMLGEELARPRPDDALVKRLKRAKLAIRDRLHRMAVATGRPSRFAAA